MDGPLGIGIELIGLEDHIGRAVALVVGDPGDVAVHFVAVDVVGRWARGRRVNERIVVGFVDAQVKLGPRLQA
ncbi:hypothetical protein D3C80_2185150 [compost metagenome]